MKTFKLWLISSFLVLLLTTQALGGVNTTNGFIYKPGIGASGVIEKGVFDAGLDRVDTRLGKEIWVGDPSYGATLQTAITAIGTTNTILRVPAGTHAIAADLTIPKNITLKPERGAVAVVATTKTLTINGPLEAGDYQIFSCAGTGKVVFPKGPRVNALWWGVVADGTTDNSTAMTQALTSVPLGGTVHIPPAVLPYGLDAGAYVGITNSATLIIEGYGAKFQSIVSTSTVRTMFTFTSSDSTGILKLRGFEIDGNKAAMGPTATVFGINANDRYGLTPAQPGITHMEVEDLYIHDCNGHGFYSQGDWGAIRNCRFERNVLNAIDNMHYGSYQEISGCTFLDCGGNAIDFSRPDADINYRDATHQVIITNNRFHNWALANNTTNFAIMVAGLPNNGLDWPSDNKGGVIISNNILQQDGGGNTGNTLGICINSDNVIVSGNIIKGYFDYSGATLFEGITFGNTGVQNVAVINNNIDNCYYGIYNHDTTGLYRKQGNVRIEGNTITDCSNIGIAYGGYDGATAPVSSYLTRNVSINNNKVKMVHRTVCDYYTDANLDSYIALNNTITGVGQSFTGNGAELTGVRFWLKRTDSDDSLTGNVTAKLYAHSGTFGTSSVPTGSALVSSTTITAQDVPTYAYLPIDFLFNISGQTLTGATHYVVTIEYAGGSATHYLMVGCDASSPTHAGNSCSYAGSWSADASKDLCFAVFTPTPARLAIYANYLHDSEIVGNDSAEIEADNLFNTKVDRNIITKIDYGQSDCRALVLANGDAQCSFDENIITLPVAYGYNATLYSYRGTFSRNKFAGGYTPATWKSSVSMTLDTACNVSQGAHNICLDNGFEFQVNGNFCTDLLTACGGGNFPDSNAWRFWNWGAGWAQTAANAMTATTASSDLAQNGGDGASFGPYNQPIVAGKLYILRYTMTRSAGTLTPYIGATAGTGRTAAGTYSEYLRATDTTALKFTGTGFSGTLSSVSLHPVDFN
jgi:hypothetical protein